MSVDLGIEGSVEARLYKLLLYGEGGHFAAHRDTEKPDAMFGTLIVALPSKHEGGELFIRYGGEEIRVDFSDPAYLYDIQFAALFADCEHEVVPVRSGYRCCLVYNLVLQEGDPAGLNASAVATEANFSLAGLKNHDQARALCLAAEKAGYVAHLALVTLHQSGTLDCGH